MPGKKKRTLKERRRRKLVIVTASIGVIVLALIVLLVMLLRLPEIRIGHVSISGTQYSHESLVTQTVQRSLSGNYFFVVPHNNTFLYPKTEIRHELKKQFPAVRSVTFERPTMQSLSITVVERKPDALWCAHASSSPCYLMDEDGFVFVRAPHEYPELVRYQGTLDGDIPAVFLSGAYPELTRFIDDVGEVTKRSVDRVVRDEHGDVFVFFEEAGGELRFVHNDASDLLLQNIASVFAAPRFHASTTPLEYADFRFGKKVYVKFLSEDSEL
ncbi:MAG: cell division protein FtsQ/DivIB [Patescibacteria group bacterium UBA2163]